jgi:hypothetical protein
MDQSNTTKAQHFLSQTEQSLNALNPAASLNNQRIYSFTLIDREAYRIRLDDAKGRNISSNLAIHDLFSFDVIGNSRQRLNFEGLFGQYEALMKTNTIELLRKLRGGGSDIKKEVLELFVAKFVNFLRNPYSVKKVLNTVGGLLSFRPTDPELLDKYNAVLAGKKPHQEYLCNELGIDAGEYQAWLSALFMALFRPRPDEMNLMERIVKAVFENPSGFPLVTVHQYVGEHVGKTCLISDRGYSIPIPEDQALSFSFNLCSNAFINYTFADIERFASADVNPRILDAYRVQRKSVRVIFRSNDVTALSSYNRHVLYQCFRSVYCSTKAIYGLP